MKIYQSGAYNGVMVKIGLILYRFLEMLLKELSFDIKMRRIDREL